MKIHLRLWALVAVLGVSIFLPISIWANSKFLNIQGTLTDTSGNPLTGNQTVTFRVYTSSTASVSSAIWTESDSLSLSTGAFNVALGSTTSLDSLPFDQLYYLGIQVAGDSNELSPRQPLGASAYAQGSLGDFNVGGGAFVQGTLVIQGTMTVQGNAFSVGGSSFAVSGGSTTIAYAAVGSLQMNNVVSGIQCLQANASGVISGAGLPCGSGGTVTGQVDYLLPYANGTQTTFTLSLTPTSASVLQLYLDGLQLSQNSDYTYIPPATISLTTAPAMACNGSNGSACSTQFEAHYLINTSTIPAAFILSSSQTVSGATTFSGATTLSGSVRFNGDVVGNGTITNSTYVYVNSAVAGTFTTSSEGPCFNGSTMTITTNGNNVQLSASIPQNANGAASSAMSCMFLRDGGYPLGVTNGVSACNTFIGGSSAAQTTVVIYDKPLAGTHQYCFTAWDSTTSQSVPSNQMAFFGAWEMQ